MKPLLPEYYFLDLTPVAIGCEMDAFSHNVNCSRVGMALDLFVYGHSCSSNPSIISRITFRGRRFIQRVQSLMVSFYLSKTLLFLLVNSA